MDLPTYTNIWRIEKRLYKLYDFRLPAPVPISWIAVFTGITVPYIFVLAAIGLPFSHDLVWLYVLPPGVLTWFTTRPVLENKRLPELLVSQLRYLGEPRTWCRMAPLAESDEIRIYARTWHRAPVPSEQAALARSEQVAAVPALAAGTGVPEPPSAAGVAVVPPRSGETRPGRAPVPQETGPAGRPRPGRPGASGPAPRRAPARPPAWPHAGMAAVRAEAPDATGVRAAAMPLTVRPRPDAADPAAPPAAADPSAAQPETAAAAESARPRAPGRVQEAPPVGGAPQAVPGVPVGPASGPGSMSGPASRSLPGAAPPVPPSTEVSHEAVPHDASGPAGVPLWAVPSGPRVPAAASGPVPAAGDRYGPDAGNTSQPGDARERGTEAVRERGTETSRGRAAEASRGRAGQRALQPGTASVPPSGSGAGKPRDPGSPHLAGVPDPEAGAEAGGATAGGPAPAGRDDSAGAGNPAAQRGLPAPASVRPAVTAPARGAATAAAATPAPVNDPAPRPGAAAAAAARQAVPSIERALSGPAGDRIDGWRRRVKVVPGGQGPGRRDQETLDRDRARLPLAGPRRIVFLGCTSGAGQTATALMTGQMLAGLRGMPVAAIDLNPGHGSLTRQAQAAPVLTVAALLAGAVQAGTVPAGTVPAGTGQAGTGPAGAARPKARLDVIASDADPASSPVADERDYARLLELAGRHYPMVMVDPGASEVTRVLGLADQLVLVAPASADAPRSLAMTQDWLGSNGHGELAARAVTVVNGVSKASQADVEQAEAVARGRCRAIVRIPWDDGLAVGAAGVSSLRPQARHGYTALAGVLVAGLAAAPVPRKVLH